MDPITMVVAGLAGAGQITQARTNVDCGPKPWFGKDKKAEWQACVNKSLDVKNQMVQQQAQMQSQINASQTDADAKARRIKIIGGVVVATIFIVVVIIVVRSRKK